MREDFKKELAPVSAVIKYWNILEAFTIVDRISTAAKFANASEKTVRKAIKLFIELGLLQRNGSKIELTQKGVEILKALDKIRQALNETNKAPRPQRRGW